VRWLGDRAAIAPNGQASELRQYLPRQMRPLKNSLVDELFTVGNACDRVE
jgi:hypothetical protein